MGKGRPRRQYINQIEDVLDKGRVSVYEETDSSGGSEGCPYLSQSLSNPAGDKRRYGIIVPKYNHRVLGMTECRIFN